MRALELKIPPLVLVFLAVLLTWLTPGVAPGLNFQIPFHRIVAWIFILAVVIVSGFGVVEIRRAKTTVNPMKPKSSSSLVTSGIYRRTRNSMYLGYFLILVGWAACNANVLSFVALPAFVTYMNRFRIKPEERALTGIFGDEFKEYRSQVRKWI